MKEFDHIGLELAEFQGKLFERSYELSCSSPIFLRRFLHSELLEKLDNNLFLSLDVNEGINSILEQFGDFDYGKEKYSRASLFWMGYLYRYISYTRGERTSFIMKLFNYKQLNSVYYVYHTQSPEWCIDNLLRLNGQTEEIFDKNIRLKNIMRKKDNS